MSTAPSARLKWGILGAGNIAKALAKGLAASKTGVLTAVGSRDLAKAEAFAREFGGHGVTPRAHGSYEALLADPDVQVVYIATPHPMHAEWAIKAAEAGKHLLVEKPIGINHAEAMAIADAAAVHNVFLMEAFMYRCHPQTAKLVELVKTKAIGDVRVIDAVFSFHAGFNPKGRLFANDMAGGGILDVGCYATSMARLIAGAALSRDGAGPDAPAEPVGAVGGAAHLGETGVDEWAVGTLKFPGGIVAQIATGVAVNQDNTLRIFGSEGSITVANAWVPGRDGGAVKIVVNRKGQPQQEIEITADPLYALEVDTVGEAVLAGRREASFPAMTVADTLGNMHTLDRWRGACGLTYESERPEAVTHTVSRRPLTVDPAARAKMKYARIAGVDKDLSRLVMGCDNQTNMPHAAVMFDDYFARGGNFFDTAFIYGGGTMERLLGQWIKNRGLREQVGVIVKGCHTPSNDPFSLHWQLTQSLERLKTDYADVYMMHRDNPDIPVGEWVDALNQEVRAGRIKAFGGSNWSLARVEAANQYARKHNLVGFTVVSNNFSLARMVNPVWAGCVAASDPDSRKWLGENPVALLAWSSQARGFFLPGRAHPDRKQDAELVRCWYSDDNFARLERASDLARRKGVETINIAAAYVLSQPFMTFALIGPRVLSETRSSLKALEVELTPDEVKWLNLEA